jgi:hypothetical protein
MRVKHYKFPRSGLTEAYKIMVLDAYMNPHHVQFNLLRKFTFYRHALSGTLYYMGKPVVITNELIPK